MYKGYEEATGKAVLLKVLTLEAAEDPVLVEWFEHEAESVAAISHPNVVALHKAGRDENGRPYLVTEYVEGASLEDVLAQHGPLPPELVAYVGAEVANGLTAAHHAGIIHRDIKPANVLLGGDGTVKLADFGLASRLVGAAGDEQTADVRGTPGYLAPETVLGEDAGPMTDLFALGATLVEALTGRKAFPSSDVSEALDSALNHDPLPSLRADPRIPAALRLVVEALLQPAAPARPTADEATTALAESARWERETIGAEMLAAFIENPEHYQALRPVSGTAEEVPARWESITTEAQEKRFTPSLRSRRRAGFALILVAGVMATVALLYLQMRPLQPTSTVLAGSDRADSLVVDFQERPDDFAAGLSSDAQDSDVGESRPAESSSAIEPELPQAASETDTNSEPVVESSEERPASGFENQATALPGRLTVTAQPWAEVFVDNRKVGEGSRVDLDQLAAGSHDVVLRNPRFPDVRRTIHINPGTDEQLAVSLWEHIARITLQVHPWANVVVDGESIGAVPPERELILSPGSHTIVLTHPQLGTWRSTVQVAAGERRTLPYNLPSLLGQSGD